MGFEGESGREQDELSPEVERFLRPRETPALWAAVVVATKAGIAASMAGAAVLAYSEQNGLGEFILAARVLTLRLTGSSSVVDSPVGLIVILLAGLACGAVGGTLFGVTIAKLIGKVGFITAVGVGVIYGILAWIILQFVIVASIAPNAVILANQHVLLLAHIVYGATLGLLGAWSRGTQPRNIAIRSSLRRLWG